MILSQIFFTVQAIQRIPKFWDRTLITKNANNEIEFQNTEIQEYLAAREITRLGNLEQSIFDFAFDPLLKEVMPSWYNTLSFLIDLNPSLLISLLDFINGGNQKIIHTEDLFKLIRVGADNFSDREKTNIFQLIFTYFQYNNIWIPSEIEVALSSYYTPLNEDLLKTSIDARRSKGIYLEVKRGNTSSIVEVLVRSNKLNNNQLNFWSKTFPLWLKENKTSPNSAFFRFTLHALISFKDINLLKEVQETYESGDDLYKQAFIEGCAIIDPDSDLSIKYFQKALFSSSTSMLDYHARQYIAKFKKKESVVEILNKCVTDRAFLIRFSSQNDDWNKEIGDSLKEFLNKVDKFWDSTISTVLNNLVVDVYTHERTWELRDGKFIFHLLDLLKKYNEDYLFQLMDEISSLDTRNSNYYEIVTCYAHLLEEDQTEKFIDKFKNLYPSSSSVLDVFFRIENLNSDKQGIIGKAKEILKKKYDENKNRQLEYEKKHGNNNNNKNKEESVYEKFRFKLEPESKKYMTNLFGYFFKNKEMLIPLITSKEKKRLEKLVEFVLKRSPKKASLKVTEKKENSSSYTVTTWVQEFIACVNLLSECEDFLNINIAQYRKNII